MGESSLTACKSDPRAPCGTSPGDRLEALVATHHPFVWRSLRRLGVPDGDVDDAVQQVFLVAHRRLATIVAESERSFLFQTALRVAADSRRASKRRREQAEADVLQVPDTAANPEELIDQRRARALLDRVLEDMPMDLRAVFVLFELEDMTMAEISTLADIPPGTVASRLRRARQVFRRAVHTMTTASATRHERKGRP
jgi:RNA polymerase sigma-70 factor, ECF subfamily